MCEHLLSDTLEGKVQVSQLLKWLVNRNPEDLSFQEIKKYSSCQADFVSFFLNYIHEIQTSKEKNGDTPQKSTTPKRLEHVMQDCGDAEVPAIPTVTRRPALFGNANPSDQAEPKLIECTPKAVRSNIDESYVSPLSPLYNRQNFRTPNDRYPVHSSPKTTPTLCLGDFITYNKSSSKKKVQRNLNENVYVNCEENGNFRTRRINPTSLNQRKCNSVNFRKNGNSFTFRNGGDEVLDNCNGQRSFLVEERMKIISRKNPGDNLTPLAAKTLIVNRKNEIVPLFELVTFREQLKILVLIYSFLVEHCFVLNVTSELYFLISVLLAKEFESDVSPNNSFNLGVAPLDDLNFKHNCSKIVFKTIHNRIYFVASILEKHVNVLKILDRSVLRLLIENRRVQQFSSPKFLSTLMLMYEHKADRLTEVPEQVQTNVCFISDTDNRDNFPSDPSFHAFRKQRDLFYETLRIWENNHLQSEWNFAVALGGKIKALLNMHGDPANFVHFARLFKAQLLMNTCGKNVEDDGVCENQLSFLSSIPNVNVEKLSRLKSRIVSKQIYSGINSVPIFTGYQEFYKDFLLVAASHVFNRHLNDALISEIVDLNDTKFNYSDLDDNNVVDAATQNAYLACIKSLRVLAKFLGFLDSLPYKSESTQLPENVVSCQVCVRNKIQPNINLKDILMSSCKNKSLILTIPWITKYIAMLDYVTLRLPYYEDIFKSLFEIYHFCCDYSDSAGHMNIQNIFLVKLCLGWLFELPHFPEGLFYTWLSHNHQRSHNCHFRNQKAQSSEKSVRMDELEIVDQNVLHVCCPYLQEIKKILSNDASSSNSMNVTIKHITPLTASESPTDLSQKRIQIQLEEAFFNSQAVSIRKTVEFVSERVASACVKQICNEIVPSYKKVAVAGLRELLTSSVQEATDESAKTALINTKTSEFAASSLQTLRTQIESELKAMTKARISPAIESLLATDVLKQTKEVCITIAARMCLDRVQQWINSHVNLGIFTKDFDGEVKKFLAIGTPKHVKPKPVFMLPMFGKTLEHNPTALSGVKVVESIREISWILIDKPDTLTADMITDLLDSVQQSLKERCDLNEYILVLVNKMLVDLALLMIAHQPRVVSDGTIIMRICQIWRQSSSNASGLFKSLMCPRNIKLLTRSSNTDMTWKYFRNFISTLLKQNLLMCDTIERQAVEVYKQISDQETLQCVSECIQSVIGEYKKTIES